MRSQRAVLVGGGGDGALERLWIERSLGAECELVEADDPTAQRVIQLLDASDASVVLLHVDADSLHDQAALLEQLLASKPNVWVVAIGDLEDKRSMLAMIRAGARDYVTIGGDAAELRAAFDRPRKRIVADDPDGDRCIVSVLCARPDADTSTLAVHLALAINQESGPSRRTVLVDIGLPSADSLVYLDLKPSYSFADAVRSVRRFDETLIETAFSRHGSGLAILPRPDDPVAMQEVQPTDALALLSVLQRYFDHIVVNVAGMRVDDLLIQILSRSDRRFLVTDQSVIGCGASRRLVEALHARGIHPSDVDLFVDRYTTRLVPKADRIAELLGISLADTLPPNGMLKVEAMNSGTSIFDLAPRSPYARAVRSLARKLVGTRRTRERPAGWLGWLRPLGIRS